MPVINIKTTEAWQEIAKSLRAAQGVNLRNVYPFVYWMEMAHKIGAFSMMLAAYREVSTARL